jgi:hypothetical protein
MSRLGKLLRVATAATATALAADRAAAQHHHGARPDPCCPPPTVCPPAQPYPYAPAQPYSLFPSAPPAGTTPATPTPAPLDLTPSAPASAPFEPTPSFASTLAGAGVGESAAVAMGGYIDNAVPVTMFRLRGDFAYRNNRPDRAEFFYAKCGCFRTEQPPQFDANGPPLPETSVDYQEVAPYFEYAFAPRFSAFLTVPVRFLNPDVNRNTEGLSDVSFGFKYALVYCPDRVVTFQLRAITPSGNTFDGLGTGNWWLEPGLLFMRQVSPRWQWFGEVRDQIPLSPRSDFTGNVLRYGLGTAVLAAQQDWGYVAPVAEFVGWTVLSGKELADERVLDAEGDTIVNAKLGVRIGFGRVDGLGGPFPSPSPTRNDIYIGYGRALTGEVWYKDVLRVEYRRFF